MVELKKIVDEAVKNCPTVQHVLVAHRTDAKVHMGNLDIPLEQVGLFTSCGTVWGEIIIRSLGSGNC